MDRRSFLAGSAAGMLTVASETLAQDVIVLRYHTLVPLQASMITKVVEPWARDIEAKSGGRVKIEFYGNMSLGGAPQSLFDQVKDGVVDFTQTVVSYTPGRFPKTETFELPFLMTNAEHTSVAIQRFVEENSMDEFAGVKLICSNTHGPGLLHVNRRVERLEDLRGLKIRGGSRVVNDMLANLGAEPITIPVTQAAEALTTGVIDGTTMPWDLTATLRLPEIVHNHIEFSGAQGLYTLAFMFVMNGAAYDALPEDVRAVFDENSGVEVARALGAVTDVADLANRKLAEEMGNTIITLDEAETARWKEAVQPTIEKWYAESDEQGIDGRALHQRAIELVAEESGLA